MAGRITSSDSQLRPDPKFHSRLLAKFINCVMTDGRKTAAERVMYDALSEIETRLAKEPPNENLPKDGLDVFERAIRNVKPRVEVRSKRIGGANYQVPIQVTEKRQRALAFRWIIVACRKEKGRPMHMRVADELWQAARGEGKAMATREQTHRMAEANKAFAHFAR